MEVSPGKMVDTIGADYIFVIEQINSACGTKLRKEQTKQVIKVSQQSFHGIKVHGFLNCNNDVCDDLGNGYTRTVKLILMKVTDQSDEILPRQ